MGIFSDAQGQLTPQSVVRSGRISNSSELSCMSSLPGSTKRIGEKKQSRKSGNTVFSIITLSVVMGTSSRIWPNFKLLQALMHVIITCKYEKDREKKHSRKSGNTVFSIITLSVVMGTSSRIWPNFKLLRALMHVIITCKYEKVREKNSREKVATPFFPL